MHGFYFSQGGSEKQQSPPTPGLPPSAGRGPETRPAGQRADRGRRGTRRSPRAPPEPTPRTRPQGRRATRRRAASPRLRGRSPKIRDPPGAEPNIARRDERHQFVAGRCDWMRPQPPLGVSLERRSAFRVDLRRSEEHTSELQSRLHLVCRLLLEKKKNRHTREKRHQNVDIPTHELLKQTHEHATDADPRRMRTLTGSAQDRTYEEPQPYEHADTV